MLAAQHRRSPCSALVLVGTLLFVACASGPGAAPAPLAAAPTTRPATQPAEKSEPLPAPLAALLLRIPWVATNDAGVDAAQQKLAEDIQAFGAVAVPHVLPLLRSGDSRIRRLAGYIVRDLPGLTEAHLDALMAARRAGDGWLPPAIGRIGSPRAVQFLVDDLRASPQGMTQVTFALRIAGPPAAVALARVVAADAPVESELASAMCEVFHELGSKADAAVDILVAHVRREAAPTASRSLAAFELGCIGPPASRAAAALLAVGASQPQLGEAMSHAVIAMGAAESVPFLIEALRAHPDVVVLRDIAEKGERVQAVGAVVVPLLKGPDRAIRVAAARTLGFIGHWEGAPALMPMLADADDWQAVYVAAESLGRLKAKAALPELDRVARDHWYAPVRDTARQAASVVRGTAQYGPSKFPHNFPFEFFAYESVQAPASGPAPALRRGPNEMSRDALKALAYDTEIVSYGEKGEERTPHRQTPDVGLKFRGGRLLGADRGEWEGELMFAPRGQALPTRLLKENIRGIHELGARVVVVTGLAHLLSNRGALYVVTTDASGKHDAAYWKTLPGAPRTSGMTRDGSLYVDCVGGAVVIRPDGRMVAP